MHEVNILDQLLPEPGAFYIMDRGSSTWNAFIASTKRAASS